MTCPRTDEATERAIVGQYALGVPVAAIAKSAGVSRPTVYKVLRRLGDKPDRKRTP